MHHINKNNNKIIKQHKITIKQINRKKKGGDIGHGKDPYLTPWSLG